MASVATSALPVAEPAQLVSTGEAGISFVVIARNDADTIGATLSSILKQTGLGEYEVLVVDDGSSDGTASIVHTMTLGEPGVRLLALQPGQGRGFARWHGVTHARYALIATVDADVVLSPDWLQRCLSHLHFADAVCGTAVPDGDVAFLHARFGLEPRPGRYGVRAFGSNAIYRRDVFGSPWFDLRLRGFEDVQLAYELSQRGVCLRAVPGLLVDHQKSRSLPSMCASMFRAGRFAAWRVARSRRLEAADVAFGGWLATVALAVRARRRGAPTVVSPGVFTAAVAAAHVGSAFRCDRSRASRFAAAVLADGLMLSLYFVGRLLGSGRLASVRSLPRQNSRRY